jgi:hypothetical protein
MFTMTLLTIRGVWSIHAQRLPVYTPVEIFLGNIMTNTAFYFFQEFRVRVILHLCIRVAGSTSDFSVYRIRNDIPVYVHGNCSAFPDSSQFRIFMAH